jgi:transcriptional regulator with GAF, ATPase, and Fis domain
MDSGYARAFAELALRLHDEPDIQHTVEGVVEGALRVVACDMASVVLVHHGSNVEIAAVTDPLAEQADQLQMDCGEGPCLTAITDRSDQGVLVRDTRLGQTWPRWERQVADLGLRSVLSIRLHTVSWTVGALNLYSRDPDRFDDDDDAIAHILAWHASIAVATAQQAETLRHAIDTRKLIGQAQGILMERFGLTDDQAFAVLRRYSQDNNVKLREVAQCLITTRRLPD